MSFFNIGPSTKPLYMYVPIKSISFFIGVALLSASLIMGCYLIFSIINNKLDSFCKKGIILLIITLMSNLVLGGNLLFIVASILSILILVLHMKISYRD